MSTPHIIHQTCLDLKKQLCFPESRIQHHSRTISRFRSVTIQRKTLHRSHWGWYSTSCSRPDILPQTLWTPPASMAFRYARSDPSGNFHCKCIVHSYLHELERDGFIRLSVYGDLTLITITGWKAVFDGGLRRRSAKQNGRYSRQNGRYVKQNAPVCKTECVYKNKKKQK